MNNNSTFIMIKKELHRFFRDPRVVLTTILLPGLLIYVIYTFLGGAMSNMLAVDKDYAYRVAVVQPSETFVLLVNSQAMLKYNLEEISQNQIESQQAKITEGEADLLVVFPPGFDQDAAMAERPSVVPNVEVYYNSASQESAQVFSMTLSLLEKIKASNFDINRDVPSADLAPSETVFIQLFSSMLPMLILTFVFSGCMAVATESIAGEKERGTIATLLVTPTKRGEVAVAKILSLGIIALCSGISSFVGLLLSLPKMIGMVDESSNSFAAMYGAQDYILLALVVLATSLLMVSLISIISAFAKTVKEATTTVTPFVLVVALVGLSAMFSGGAQRELLYYMIPLYNSVNAMAGIFAGAFSMVNVWVAVVSNLVYTIAAAYVLARLFSSEKVMFSK
ncbi:MAG: ABC transporter permease subunit [Peptococcaceae bacterium]|nr:ABC transporter permease subunit [Peptococcaceae bacterium]